MKPTSPALEPNRLRWQSTLPRPSQAWIDALRARTPSADCIECGEPIGAARLTLHPGTPFCAWCAPRTPVRAVSGKGPAPSTAH